MTATATLDRFLSPVRDIASDVAQRLIDFQLDSNTQARLDDLARKANQGQLTPDEKAEYSDWIEKIDLIAIVQSKARDAIRNADR